MRPAVHLRTEHLPAHAAAAAELAAVLHAVLDRRPIDYGPPHTELSDTLRRAARELAELSVVLASVAASAESADAAAARSLRDAGRP